MNPFSLRPIVLLLTALLAIRGYAAQPATVPDPARVQAIAAWLPTHPCGMGEPLTNRAAWDKLSASHPELAETLTNAAKVAAEPLGPQRDDLYLEFSRNGNRERWQDAEFPRRDRIGLFTMAECLENQGRFLAPLEQAIAALCAERTWVYSAHDHDLKNFHGEIAEVDLGTATLACELATADYLLGNKLSPATRRLIRDNVERRVFAPYRRAVGGKDTTYYWFWIHGNSNWNAVCEKGVIGAALALLDRPEDRAWFVAVAEKNIGYYLGGFNPDGYCG